MALRSDTKQQLSRRRFSVRVSLSESQLAMLNWLTRKANAESPQAFLRSLIVAEMDRR